MIDLNVPDQAAAMRDLIAGADVFSQGYRLGTLDRRGEGLYDRMPTLGAHELLIENPSDQLAKVCVRKREGQVDLVAEILGNGNPIQWTDAIDHVVFRDSIRPQGEKYFQVVYREQADTGTVVRSLGFELSVATRRMLSEFRDGYLSRSRFFISTVDKL